MALTLPGFAAEPAGFTPFCPVPAKVLGSAPAYPGGQFEPGHLVDGDSATEYASDSRGTHTYVEFDFGREVDVVALRHVDRNDRATVGESEVEFLDSAARKTGSVRVKHAQVRSGETFLTLPKPVSACKAVWRVVKLGPDGLSAVGGAEFEFFAAAPQAATPASTRLEAQVLPFLTRSGQQPVTLHVTHPYLEPAEVVLSFGTRQTPAHLQPGNNTFEFMVEPVAQNTERIAQLLWQGRPLDTVTVTQSPVPPMAIYILPHSHTDIGYTDLQPRIEEKQVANLLEGLRLAERTAHYPEGARFVWNVEVLWAADLFLHRSGPEAQRQLARAVRDGRVELNGMYLNLLSGLCRPEELLQSFKPATDMSRAFGAPVLAAMVSDLPGHTWGSVTAMADAGIRYLSTAPNYGERSFMQQWENRPFYWVAPDGKSRVLVWIPFQGYALSHRYDELSPKLLSHLLNRLRAQNYPYELAYIRWAGRGDNGVPDGRICDFVKHWNESYASPRLVISGTTAAFRALEQRYGNRLPEYRGDWTPYWEDGAGSTAHETALNRNTAERLAQAQTLFALLAPDHYPVAEFQEAWKQTWLFSEHTWGASDSVRSPEGEQTQGQWRIKQSFALEGDRRSRELAAKALSPQSDPGNSPQATSFNVVNTLSWPRSGLVTLPAAFATNRSLVKDAAGRPVLSQRLTSGELVFLAEAVPPLAAKRFSLCPGLPAATNTVLKLGSNTLENALLSLSINPKSGGIAQLKAQGGHEFAGRYQEAALNDYLYLAGTEPNPAPGDSPCSIHAGETGPLLISLVVESKPAGSRHLRREVRLLAGQDYVEVLNLLDKERLLAKDYRAKTGKESVHFAFPFHVPDGRVALEIPFATMEPATGQLPLACSGWFIVGRWVDLANSEVGVTWVSLDAPLVVFDDPVAALTTRRPMNPSPGHTGHWFSWVMNNRWGTNYKAYQEGPTLFRYALRPHGRGQSPAEATRFATELSQPLLATPASELAELETPLVSVDGENILVAALKPADTGHALILRLYEAAGKPTTASLKWGRRQPKAVYLSDVSEAARQSAPEQLEFAAHALITLRAEF